MLLPETSYSQEEKPDTILHITTPSKVVVTENASGSKVEVRSLTDDEELIASVFTGYSSESSVRLQKSGGFSQQLVVQP